MKSHSNVSTTVVSDGRSTYDVLLMPSTLEICSASQFVDMVAESCDLTVEAETLLQCVR